MPFPAVALIALRIVVPPGTPRWGSAWKAAAAFHYNRTFTIHAHGGCQSYRGNCLDLDPTYKDRFGRPLMQTEYMARPRGSTFDPILGYQKDEKVNCYCWGFVSGKTQTIYPWDSWTTKYMGEPPLWFHDIIRTDGAPYKQDEVAYIRRTTGKTP